MGNQGMAVPISRQMGSGGTFIGREIAKALGFSYVDREILHQAADLLKKDEGSLEEYEERSSGLLENLFRFFALGTPETMYVPRERPVYDRELFVLESRIIRDVVEKSNAVVIGRGGFHILKGRPNTVHLFIHAPRSYRIDDVMKSEGLSDVRGVQARIDESDRNRAKFIRDMVGKEWSDARNYHLSVDSSLLGLAETGRMAIGFLKAVFD